MTETNLHDARRDDAADRMDALMAELVDWQRRFRSTVLADYDALGSIAPTLLQFDDTVDDFQCAACCIRCERKLGAVLLDKAGGSLARYCHDCATTVTEAVALARPMAEDWADRAYAEAAGK
jgi:hypothetical protein